MKPNRIVENPDCIFNWSRRCSEAECFAYEVIANISAQIDLKDIHPNTKKKLKQDIEKNRRKLEMAYYLSKISHWNQKRKNWESYFSHPQSVVNIILYEFEFLDIKAIILWLLHDIVEEFFMERIVNDHNIPEAQEIQWKTKWIEALSILFGKEIADYVDSLTKNKTSWLDEETKKLRTAQYFIDMEYFEDIELIVKIADRIHNLRTIKTLWIEHINKKINETMKYFLPIIWKRIEKIKHSLEKNKKKDRKHYILQEFLKIYTTSEKLLNIELNKARSELHRLETREVLFEGHF